MLKILKVLVSLLVIALVGLATVNQMGIRDIDEVALAEQEIGLILDSQLIALDDSALHVVFAGPSDGEPVILIHGFPQFWYTWRWHIKALATAGYRVAAVDMRGYNRSPKPNGIAAYSYENYAKDIVALMDHFAWAKANIVAHDIGGFVAWELIFDNAQRVRKAVIFSTPHPLAIEKAVQQSDVSWYRTFFRIPVLPELVNRLGGLALTAESMRDTSNSDTFNDSHLAIYKSAWQRDDAMDTMLGAYRNNGLDISNMPDDGRPLMPVMYINGEDDKFVPLAAAQANNIYLGEQNVIIVKQKTHWVLEEAPELTAAQILSFLDQPNQ
ncbi:MAG: pimeloyl-ACP methyl ester carboxylesterase [Cryomorphaceae bacterium]|jgi:pimeloyl-ACP methyl ester carboxylesterase